MEKAKIKKNGWVAWSKDQVKLLKKLFPLGRARRIAKDGSKFRCKECSKKANRNSYKKRRLAVRN